MVVSSMPTPAMKWEETGSGEPLVLVPGGLTGWISWKPHAEQLSAAHHVVRVQLLAVDYGLRGEALQPDYSVKTESRALRDTLDGIGIVRADFAGWSYGAEVLLDFALDHPDRVLSMTLIEPPAFWTLRSRGPLSADALEFQKATRSFGPREVSETQLAQFAHFAGFVPRGTPPQEMPQWPLWVQHRQSLRTGDAAFRHNDDISRVQRFDRPVLLFKGEGSPDYLRAIIDVLGEELPNGRVEELPGAHALHIASIDRFMDIFSTFLTHVRTDSD